MQQCLYEYLMSYAKHILNTYKGYIFTENLFVLQNLHITTKNVKKKFVHTIIDTK